MMEFSTFDNDDEQPETLNTNSILGFEASSMRRTRFASGIRLGLLLFLGAVFVSGITYLVVY